MPRRCSSYRRVHFAVHSTIGECPTGAASRVENTCTTPLLKVWLISVSGRVGLLRVLCKISHQPFVSRRKKQVQIIVLKNICCAIAGVAHIVHQQRAGKPGRCVVLRCADLTIQIEHTGHGDAPDLFIQCIIRPCDIKIVFDIRKQHFPLLVPLAGHGQDLVTVTV
nr:MAG TPA: hypothetical protein [Caudoviricetes sp.]